ncbi:MAG: ester cyclase [Planctomycetota bacterium]
MSKSPNALVEEWFERVWNQCDENAVYEMMDPTCNVAGLDTKSAGPEGFLGFHRSFQNAFDSIHIEVTEAIEQDDLCIGHARFTATHKGTGKPVDMVFSASTRWRDGKIYEARNIVDFTTMLIQIGLLDPQIMVQALGE